MTDEKLNDLEATCRIELDKGGKVSLRPGDLLELVTEVRELRKKTADLGVPEQAIATMRRLAVELRAYWKRRPSAGVTVSNWIPVQDPGR